MDRGFIGRINGPTLATKVRQVQQAESVAYASATTIIPNDDTIPTATEGFLVASVAITPESNASKLTVGGYVHASNGSAGVIGTMTLLKATATQAFAVGAELFSSANNPHVIFCERTVTATGIAAQTFDLRAGANSGDMFLNGSSTARVYGGISNCKIWVVEHD
jgi:hypothetical protein